MPQYLAYHVVVHAMEGRAGWTPMQRFAASVAHINNGHLPYVRHYAAGWRRASEGASERQIAESVREFLYSDLTPAVRLISSMSCPRIALEGFNEYNASSGVGVQTSVAMSSRELGLPDMITRRQMRIDASDPPLCRTGTLALLDEMLARVHRNARAGGPAARLRLSGLAGVLGVSGSAASDVATVFELDGSMGIDTLARKLGCHPRSLARQLKSEGCTAESIRAAVRLQRASDRLESHDSLTTIAVEEGFSDLSHMTRSFKQAAGMQPSLLRRLLQADLVQRVARSSSVMISPT